LSQKWRWLAYAFAFFGAFAAFGIGNMVQANSVADAIHAQFQIPASYTAIALTLFSAIVILGGIRRIAEVVSGLVLGSFVFAAACAMGALPSPASLEKIPRATPKRIAAQTAAPVKPPTAAVSVKALCTIKPSAWGTSW
jgi:AGCS family alanine or glycine:cation symporter